MTRSSPSPPDAGLALLRDLAAAPRPTGTAAIAGARSRVAAELGGLGFAVHEEPFRYSAWPGRFGTPAIGAGIAALAAVAGHVGSRTGGAMPLAILAGGGLVLFLAARWLMRTGVTGMSLMRSAGVNLVAQRGRDAPQLWLCAHLDSKSQPVPSFLRMAGVVVTAGGLLALFALAGASAVGMAAPFAAWGAATAVTLAGTMPVVLSVVGADSPGALDNASGVATVVEAARQLARGDRVGVLITDAEELGLAGALAWGRANPGSVVLNCDGVDDHGANVVMYSANPPERLLHAARASGAAPRRMPPGLLTDSVAFSLTGSQSVTFSRGTYASLLRVHRRADSLDRLSGAGIASASTLMAATARELLRS